MAYRISVIGTGYVGLVSGTIFAATGNRVTCVDVDESKIEMLKNGISPIYEPGLEPILQKNVRENRLFFTSDLENAALNSQIIFFCLPTPPNEDGSADLSRVLETAEKIATVFKNHKITDPRIVVNKSTAPVGTVSKIREIFNRIYPNHNVHFASNPEFLREGFAIEDSMKPERIVIGTQSKYAEEALRDLYEPFVRSGNPIYVFDERSAEVTKYAANSFLATKISFMNDLARFCEAVGADIEKVRIGIGSDSRIGKRFLFAGIGFGGSCFPKDVRALMKTAEEAGTPLSIVKSTYEVNERQVLWFFEKILKRFSGDLKDLKFALWGLAFKPNTDDVREAPAFKIIDLLLQHSGKVVAYDPEAIENTRKVYGERIEYATDMYNCLENADALIIATEWTVFRNPDFELMQSLMKQKIIFDGRNIYTFEEMRQWNFEYFCVGRTETATF